MLEDVVAEGYLAVGGHYDVAVATDADDGGRADTASLGGCGVSSGAVFWAFLLRGVQGF
jgi:hypothetical protein